jgi:hypothetical protein
MKIKITSSESTSPTILVGLKASNPTQNKTLEEL